MGRNTQVRELGGRRTRGRAPKDVLGLSLHLYVDVFLAHLSPGLRIFCLAQSGTDWKKCTPTSILGGGS